MPYARGLLGDCKKAFIDDYVDRMKAPEPYGTDGKAMPGTKVVVTKLGLDKWVAQVAGMSLDKFPR
jgi:hypothetical protein